MKIFNQIEKELVGAPRSVREPIEVLFRKSQEYYRYYQINESCSEAINVLQNYMEADELISTRTNGRELQREKSLDVSSKLHIEFIWNVYKNRYGNNLKDMTEQNFFVDIIENECRKERIIELLENNSSPTLLMYINDSIDMWIDNYTNCKKIDDLNIENLHDAMSILQVAWEQINPTIEESVEDILVPDILENALRMLQAKNFAGCLFTLAPITRALTSGAIESFTPKNKDKKTIYFSINFIHNLSELSKRMDGFERILLEYIETKECLTEDWKKYIG